MGNSRYKAFVASVETGSFLRAAERINYTPSGVCQLINSFEKEIGCRVLERGTRGVSLTPAGETILPIVRDILAREEYLSSLCAGLNGHASGSITIGTYSSIAGRWLPPVIKAFREKYPYVEIHLMEGIRQEIEEWLASGAADIALYSYQEPMLYDWIPLAEDRMLAVLPPDHPLAKAESYPLKNCQDENFILACLGHDDDVIPLFRRSHLNPKIAVSTLENFSAMAMIEQGMGMSIMNELITENWVCNVVKLPLDPPQSILLGLAVPSMQKAPVIVKAFVDSLVERMRADPKEPV